MKKYLILMLCTVSFLSMSLSVSLGANPATQQLDFPYSTDNQGNLGAEAGLNIARENLPQGVEKQDSLKDLILGWVTFFLQFYTLVAVGIVVYLGIKMVVSMGNEEQRKETIKALINLAIGTVLIYLSYAIVNTIVNVITPEDLLRQTQQIQNTNP